MEKCHCLEEAEGNPFSRGDLATCELLCLDNADKTLIQRASQFTLLDSLSSNR